MSVRILLLIVNGIALAAVVAFVIVTLRATPAARPPRNVTAPPADEDLEGHRLERALALALICSAVIAVSLPLYWLREPDRQQESIRYFDKGAAARGAVLFANKQSTSYSNVTSLLCADCHGVDGNGGVAPTTYTARAGGTPMKVSWAAPSLTTVLLRFSAAEVRTILTYGRPGTPMQAWGVAGGGPKNDQSLDDLLAYLTSIQISPEAALAQSAAAVETWRDQPQKQLGDAKSALADARSQLKQVRSDSQATPEQHRAAEDAVAAAARALKRAEDWVARRDGVGDGQLLYEVQCARCHTANWSIFDPTVNTPEEVDLGPAGGGGSHGSNLRGGGVIERFGPDATAASAGFRSQADFLRSGSDDNMPYGIGGIGSGRMPGFTALLTDDQITAIVEYQTSMLDRNDPSTPGH